MAKEKLPLNIGETLVLQYLGAYRADDKKGSLTELNLTTQRIIHVQRTTFTEKVKDYEYFSLQDIRITDGEAQVYHAKDGDRHILQIHMLDGSFTAFYFAGDEAREEILKWIDNICIMLTGRPGSPLNDLAPKKKKGLGGLMSSFAAAFNDPQPTREVHHHYERIIEPEPEPERYQVTKKCIGCRAPVTGWNGDVVKCKYCDTDNSL